MWLHVARCHPAARALADRHYSRQTVGAQEFLPPGRPFVLLAPRADAVWAVVENVFRDACHFRCVLFRNEGAGLSSELIAAATARTYHYWRDHYGALPPAALRTEVDPTRVRKKRDPGRCFLRAGWRVVGLSHSHRHRGALVLEAPPAPAELRTPRQLTLGGT